MDLKKFEEKNTHDLTEFMNGKNITGFSMTLDDRFSAITLHLDDKYIIKLNFQKIQDFTVNEIGS